MKFRIRVRDQYSADITNTYDFEGNMVGHDDIMKATGNNPFYERGMLLVDGDRIIQFIRIKEQA